MARITAGLLLCLLSIGVFAQEEAREFRPDPDCFIGVWLYKLDEVFDFEFTITDSGYINWDRTEPDPGLSSMNYGGSVRISFHTNESGGYTRGFATWSYSGARPISAQGTFEMVDTGSGAYDTIELTLYLNSDIYLIGSAGMWTTITLARVLADEESESD